jgi:hypothetical protein
MEFLCLDLETGESVTGPWKEYKSDNDIDTSAYPYQYDIRYDDDLEGPCTIEPGVVVNYFGTIWLEEPLILNNQGYLTIDDWSHVSEYDCPIHGKLGSFDGECPRC